MANPSHDLLPCPFCGGAARIESNRDWHRIYAAHDDECVFDADDHALMYPAQPGYLIQIAEDWNRRATPPSPSTAPEVKTWQQRVDWTSGELATKLMVEAMKQEIAELRAALASRPAEVDDEGLPALPTAFVRIDMDDGSIWGQIQDEYWENEQQISLGIDDPLFTAEQYRQGQRDAVAADRARREDGWISVEDRLPAKDVDVLVYLPNNGDPLIEMDAWGEIYECPVSFSSHSICVGEGWGNNDFDEVSHWMPMPVAPSHTTNKENG